MPIYEYQCGCGYVFDELILPGQKSKIKNCPSCGSKKFSAYAKGYGGSAETLSEGGKKKISKFLRARNCQTCKICSNCEGKNVE
jgi:putative FmdB family regulatory protein